MNSHFDQEQEMINRFVADSLGGKHILVSDISRKVKNLFTTEEREANSQYFKQVTRILKNLVKK